MNSQTILGLALFLALNPAGAFAQTQTNDAQKRALELLRKTVAETSTKPPAAPVPTAPAAVKPAPVAPTVVAAPAPVPVDLERRYLEGQITAKQFQKLLEESRRNPPKPAAPVVANDPRVLEALRKQPPAPAPAPAPAKQVYSTIEPVRGASALAPRIVPADEPKPVEPPPISPAAQSQLSAVEKKMDELMNAKAARDRAGTNATPVVAAGPKTKRDRLDDLLRLLINGKITDAEYKQQHEKVVTGPD